MSDITIDGKEYKQEDMSQEQISITQKLTQLVNTENNLQLQLADIEILKNHYINQFKSITDKE